MKSQPRGNQRAQVGWPGSLPSGRFRSYWPTAVVQEGENELSAPGAVPQVSLLESQTPGFVCQSLLPTVLGPSPPPPLDALKT